jgi:hypothetical protein
MSEGPSSDTLRHRLEALHPMISAFAWVPVWMILVPLMNVYVPRGDTWIYLIPSLIPAAFFARGVHAMQYPELRSERPNSIGIGALFAILFLGVGVESMRLAIVNRELEVWWPVMVLTGIAASLAYLAVAYRLWRRKPAAT